MTTTADRIDASGRTVVPASLLAHLRARTGATGSLYLVPEPERRFLELMSAAHFDALMTRVRALPATDPLAMHYRGADRGADLAVAVDDEGALRVQRTLRTLVGIDVDVDDVVWRVRGDVVELWAWQELYAHDPDAAPPRLPAMPTTSTTSTTPTFPPFLACEARTIVGPYALWAPRAVGPLQRWWGVDRACPTTRFAVVTAPGWSEDLAFLDGDDDGGAGRLGDERTAADVSWAVRRAHPGLRLSELVASDEGGVPPVELLVAVVRALTRGVRALRPVQGAADVVVGVDGFVTVDGFDDPRPFDLSLWRGPTLADDDACRALVASVLSGIGGGDVDGLLRRVRTQGVDLARERRIVAGVVQGLAPDVVVRLADEADQLGLLGEEAWASWATIDGVQHVFDDVLDARIVADLRALARSAQRGDEDILGELTSVFERDGRMRLPLIESAWREDRPKDAERSAGCLRGAARLLGARRVGDLAEEIERANHRLSNRAAFDAALMERLRMAFEDAVVALRAVFGVAPRR